MSELTKRCKLCGKVFTTEKKAGRTPDYCSEQCTKQAIRERCNAKKRDKLALHPHMAQCPACGEMFRKMGRCTYCPKCRPHFKHGDGTKTIRSSECTPEERRDVMRVALTVPESKRYDVTRRWPKCKLDLLRDVYRMQHGL